MNTGEKGEEELKDAIKANLLIRDRVVVNRREGRGGAKWVGLTQRADNKR